MRNRTLHLILYILLLPITVLAQPICTVKTYGIRDGLQTSHIEDMLQDRQGMIWLATWNGLVCYDGYRFLAISNMPRSQRLIAITEDASGSIRCRTMDNKEYLFDPSTHLFTEQRATGKASTATSQHQTYSFTDSRHRTWTFTQQPGVTLTDASHNLSRHLLPVQAPSGQGTVSNLPLCTEDRNHTIWCVPRGGVFSYFDEHTQQLVPYTLHTNDGTGIMPYIWRTMQDRDGNLWCTSNHGLHMLSFGSRNFTATTFLPQKETRALCFDPSGTLWAGNTEGGIAAFSPSEHASLLQLSASQYVEGMVYSIFRDSHGRQWIATKGNGIYVKTPDGRLTNYRHTASDAFSLSHDNVYDITEDAHGNIYIATFGGGLNIADETSGTLRFIHRGNLLRQYPRKGYNRVRRIAFTPSGQVILSTTDGILCLTPSRGKPQAMACHVYPDNVYKDLASRDIMQTLVTRSGTVILATMRGELLTLNARDLPSTLSLAHIESAREHRSIAYALAEDKRGDVWVVRERYLEKLDRNTLKSHIFSSFGAGQQLQFTETTPALSPKDGTMAVATLGGFVTFNPERLSGQDAKPRIVFPYVLFTGSQEPQPLLSATTLDVSPEHRSLNIYFSAIDFTDNTQIRYAYRLDGVDREWRYVGTEHCASYTDLPPGRHVLTVRSTDSNGVWTDNEVTLTLDVQPVFWETIWAKMLYLLAAICVAWLLWRYYDQRRKARYRENILKRRVEEIVREHRILQQTLQQIEADKAAAKAKPMPSDTTADYRLADAKVVDEDRLFMDQLLEYLEQHIGDADLRVDDVATAVGTNRSSLTVRLKAIVGVSPSDFIRQLRLQRAIDLVAHSTMRFNEIAFATGFSDQRYFSRVFKSETGLTPSEYRSNAKSAE